MSPLRLLLLRPSEAVGGFSGVDEGRDFLLLEVDRRDLSAGITRDVSHGAIRTDEHGLRRFRNFYRPSHLVIREIHDGYFVDIDERDDQVFAVGRWRSTIAD